MPYMTPHWRLTDTGRITERTAEHITGRITERTAEHITGRITERIAGHITGHITERIAGHITECIGGHNTYNRAITDCWKLPSHHSGKWRHLLRGTACVGADRTACNAQSG